MHDEDIILLWMNIMSIIIEGVTMDDSKRHWTIFSLICPEMIMLHDVTHIM